MGSIGQCNQFRKFKQVPFSKVVPIQWKFEETVLGQNVANVFFLQMDGMVQNAEFDQTV